MNENKATSANTEAKNYKNKVLLFLFQRSLFYSNLLCNTCTMLYVCKYIR